MAFTKPNSENRQHINLSAHALAVIENDMFAFDVNTKSGFLNQVIFNFKYTADASISEALRRKTREYIKLLNDLEPNIQKNVLEKLTDNYRQDLQKKANSYEKGMGIKFRINDSNIDFLTNECGEDKYYISISNNGETHDNLGKYLKALIEEYCSKSYLEREEIYFYQEFQLLHTAIKLNKKIKFKLPRENSYRYLKPYKITTDPLSMYHYLIGISIDDNHIDNETSSFSYRITNLRNLTQLNEKIFISSDMKKCLEKELQEKGPQFMIEHIIETKVYLTLAGIAKYKRLLHLRPQYTAIEDTNIYVFHCTPRQIEYYFFKFGEDAIILSPKELSCTFKSMYKKAYTQYTGSRHYSL